MKQFYKDHVSKPLLISLRLVNVIVWSPLLASIFVYEYLLIAILDQDAQQVTASIVRQSRRVIKPCILIYPGSILLLRWFLRFCLELFNSGLVSLQARLGIRANHFAIKCLRKLALVLYIVADALACVFFLPVLAIFGCFMVVAPIVVWTKIVSEMVHKFYLTWNQSVYEPLEHSSLRLLRVHPGRSKDRIRCDFVHSTFQSPSYEALSYTWEIDYLFRRVIYLNRRQYLIPVNVYKVPQQIRRLNEEIMIWIDFICINQNDISERVC